MDPNEVAHYEPLHVDLCCLQIQLFSFLPLRVNVLVLLFHTRALC